MKKLLPLILLVSLQSHAYSIGETVASPILTAGALLEATIVAPTAATAGTSVSAAYRQEVANNTIADIENYEASGHMSAALADLVQQLQDREDLSVQEAIDALYEAAEERQ